MVLLSLDSICVPSEDVVSREVEGELIIVPIASGIGNLEDELYTLNETGQAIWRKLEGNSSLRSVVEELVQEYDSSFDDIAQDVLGLCNELLKRKILVCEH